MQDLLPDLVPGPDPLLKLKLKTRPAVTVIALTMRHQLTLTKKIDTTNKEENDGDLQTARAETISKRIILAMIDLPLH